METTSGKVSGASRANDLILFVTHQFVATLGVLVAAPYVTNFFRNFLSIFGWAIEKREVSWILSETPYFPAQVLLALFFGWLLRSHFRHRSMLWVWVLPCAILCSVVIAFPTTGQLALAQYASLSSPFRLSHFFGSGCQPTNRCLDQLLFTMPFYSAAAYSLGAALAGKVGGPDYIQGLKAINIKRAILIVGVPSYCFELAANWGSVRGLPFSRTGHGIFLYFGLALIESAIASLLFIAVTGFVCQQLFAAVGEKGALRSQGARLAHN